jgi:Flp pilus assembly protein protease CpaA
VLVYFVLVYIALFDIKSHRVPNASLLYLAALSIFERGLNLDLRILVVTTCLVGFFTLISGCGYGDSKLCIIILNLIVPSSQFTQYLLAVLLASALLVLVHLIRNRSMRGEIAFAPALCGAALVLTH